ncbi:transglycosylase SLT domain-containing protein [Streptomyces sp. NPDC090026]|uniref:transglycosylase SLT domain-containing protein n=1 Tax=Streptomyces sp. NPDC090026 TaxID=3365923 RepID=UPI0037FE20BA
MPAQGKHRRPRSRRIALGLVAVGTGGAALALPLLGATTASAAQPAHAPAAPAAAVAAPAVAQQSAPVTYSVVAGDSLSAIAVEHSVDGGWQKLYQDNREAVGDNPSLIHPGLELTIGGGRAEADRADRSAERVPAATGTAGKSAPAAQTAAVTYPDNLDGWIREALSIMKKHGIPGSYEGIHRNIMRESSGNPLAINNWDINAQNGVPSKGLLQVIKPTFDAYHVAGTKHDQYDPVANIVAACNYAADRYGSIDNVNGPY